MKNKIFLNKTTLLLLVLVMQGFVYSTSSASIASTSKSQVLRQQEAEALRKRDAEAADALKYLDDIAADVRKQEQDSLKQAPKVSFEPLKKLEAPAASLYQDTVRPRPLPITPTLTAAPKTVGVAPEPIVSAKVKTIQAEDDAALKQKQLEETSASFLKGWDDDFGLAPARPVKQAPTTPPGLKQTKEEAPFVPYKPVSAASAAEIRAATMEQIRSGRIPSLDAQQQKQIASQQVIKAQQAQQEDKKSTIQSKLQAGLKQIKTTVIDRIVPGRRATKDVVEKEVAAKDAQINDWIKQANPKDPAVKAALDNESLYSAYKKAEEDRGRTGGIESNNKFMEQLNAQKLGTVAQRMELNFGLMAKLNLEKQAAAEEKAAAAKKSVELTKVDATAKRAAEATDRQDSALASKMSDTKKSLSQEDQARAAEISNKKFIGEEKLTAAEEKVLKNLDARPDDKRLVEEQRSAMIEREKALQSTKSNKEIAEGTLAQGAQYNATIAGQSKNIVDKNLTLSRQMAEEAAAKVAAQKAAASKGISSEEDVKRAAAVARTAELRKAAEDKAASAEKAAAEKLATEGMTFGAG